MPVRCWLNHVRACGILSSGEGWCEDNVREDLGLGADIPGGEGMLLPTRGLPELQKVLVLLVPSLDLPWTPRWGMGSNGGNRYTDTGVTVTSCWQLDWGLSK